MRVSPARQHPACSLSLAPFFKQSPHFGHGAFLLEFLFGLFVLVLICLLRRARIHVLTAFGPVQPSLWPSGHTLHSRCKVLVSQF